MEVSIGYEVTYHYREEVEGSKGQYEEEIKQKTAKIGKGFEEVSLEVLAGKIIAQLARRNILVVDVEIHEYVRKKLSYRESPDGILIKNKKFRFDDGAVVEAGIEDPGAKEELAELLANNPELLQNNSALSKPLQPQPQTNLAPRPQAPATLSGRRPIRHEIYDPDIASEHRVIQRGLKFTKGKRYPIFEENTRVEGSGIIMYTTVDDAGKETEIGNECFTVPTQGIRYENVVKEDKAEDIDLWGSTQQVSSDMPDLRGG